MGYRRIAVDVEIIVSNKKTIIPPVKDLEELMIAVTIPKEVSLKLKQTFVVIHDS